MRPTPAYKFIGSAQKTQHDATTIATDTAQIVFMDQTLENLPTLIDLSHELQGNLMTSLILVTVPGLCVISGVFLFGVGIPMVSYTMAGVVGMTDAMLPVFRRRLTD